MSDIVQRLWDSDQASALTNEAAREIERRDWIIDSINRVLQQYERSGSRDPVLTIDSVRTILGRRFSPQIARLETTR
jgi:hypothetical protein